ncbi:MAG: non-hydrolyzing UDP-N-acetylglucosamine 2-epimerase [Acidimicrobiia bacterium]
MRKGAVAIVFGTRPELVKLAPVLWALGDAAVTVHTGQHGRDTLADIAADLELGGPTRSLAVPATPVAPGRQIGETVTALTDVLAELVPDVVVVQGDTNSTLAGALAAAAAGIPVVHVEAGLRSFDRGLPEERNRVVVDHISELLCAPTETARTHLLDEGVGGERIVVTGNTVVDAAARCLPDPATRRAVVRALGLEPGGYTLATFHRQENVDDLDALDRILTALGRCDGPVLLPMHPRTRDRAEHGGLVADVGALRTVDAVSYRTFLALEAESALIVSDSGGVQEEASIVKRPILVVRRSTERPEIIGTFGTLVGDVEDVPDLARAALADTTATARLGALATPFGDGTAGARIAAAIATLIGP